tara:strand:+ start:161 stop:424 length:264 start_codon:yes stop_codon:yes gene_type:complete
MIKELKYIFFLLVIFFFIFFSVRFYFSDENIKNSHRSTSLHEEKLKETEYGLILLKNNTESIIEFVKYKNNKKTKEYSFWKLIYNDE